MLFFSTRIAAAMHLVIVPINAHTAEKTVVPRFKNVDEAIGWVKAKGDCRNEQGISSCNIWLDLPDQKNSENEGESLWRCRASMNTLDAPFTRIFGIRIVRSKDFLLVANDKKSLVHSSRVTSYTFNTSGEVQALSVGFVLENFKGETILRQSIPVPIESFAIHTDGLEDVSLIYKHLGVDWKWLKLK